ncbi:DUF3147 family protein [Glaciimonas soli]|uniref:DUF3147 family protein n=1 Tax=Glaciimonas soli TaxID=2590999 RepID=A0A843YVN3_9BURK|nr:DUF3147 family protein [Glaciimonas soli]MQR01292.1 hypothetical protein [Glaciimonas soli]
MNVPYVVMKYLLTAGVVVFVSELAKRSDRLGSLVASLPLVTILTLIWLYVEKQPIEKVSNHAYYTFWYVIPTLPMFLLFPYLIQRMSFVLSLVLCILFTVVVFYFYALLLRRFGIDLL